MWLNPDSINGIGFAEVSQGQQTLNKQGRYDKTSKYMCIAVVIALRR